VTGPARVSDVHRHEHVVSADEIDMLGHASNIAYVRWVQDAAVAHSESVGLGLDGYSAVGAVFVVRRHELDYMKPAFHGDVLVAETWIETWTGVTSMRRTRITRGDEELARAVTTWAFIDPKTGRPTRIPESVRAVFAARKDDDATRGG
jgi:acyl-CoA thioester hydrolase